MNTRTRNRRKVALRIAYLNVLTHGSTLVQPPEAHYSINQIRSIIGKTVERVEYGFCQSIKRIHQGEAIILHFTDGSILGIDTGSNAVNVADDYEGLQPEDFHTDFMLCWVPAPNNSTLQ